MRICNLGSLNIDRVYGVEHFVSAQETVLATKYERFLGGKGLNQSIALARSGGTVFHAGAIGPDGMSLRQLLEENGVDTRYLKDTHAASGHAIIQVNASGQNCIIVSRGANAEILPEDIDRILSDFGQADLLLLQNEISNVDYAIQAATARGMSVAFNAAPVTPELHTYPIDLVDYLIVNEVEGLSLLGTEACGEESLLHSLCRKYPSVTVILTVGEKGSYWGQGDEMLHQEIYPVSVVDTTAAGDTFCGYFITSIAKGKCPKEALRIASLASSLAIGQKGAACSIPTMQEVTAFGQSKGIPSEWLIG